MFTVQVSTVTSSTHLPHLKPTASLSAHLTYSDLIMESEYHETDSSYTWTVSGVFLTISGHH